MLYVDIPTLPEFKALAVARADACVSIYLPTTPLTQDVAAARIALRNLTKEAVAQLEQASFDKRRLGAIDEQLAALHDDDEFWKYQANSLGVLVTPDTMRTFRLPNRLTAMAEVSDRFHLKPLLRAITFPHEAFVLALSEKGVRLVEVFSDLAPFEVKIDGVPKNAADAVGRATVNERSPRGRLQADEGQKVLLRQYARKVDAALRGVLSGRETPLILAATDPLASIYRSVNSYPGLLAAGIAGSHDRTSDAELAAAARPILDKHYAAELDAAKARFENLASRGLATTDMSDAARAATYGAVESLLVDMDEVVPGTVSDDDGKVTFADAAGAGSYGIVDEIAGRALLSGAKVLAVRRADIPRGAPLAAVLRYAV